jgi:hypothetical protein
MQKPKAKKIRSIRVIRVLKTKLLVVFNRPQITRIYRMWVWFLWILRAYAALKFQL